MITFHQKKHIIQTGFSVYFSVLITYFFFANSIYIGSIGFDTFSIFIAGVTAAICSQVEDKDTYRVGTKRVYGTLSGSFVAFFITFLLNELYTTQIPVILYVPLLCGLGTTLIFYLFYSIKGSPTATVGSVALLGVLLQHPNGTTYEYIVGRFIATVIGVVFTLLVSKTITHVINRSSRLK